MRGSYKDLRVWKQARELANAVYRATESFPKHEFFGITNQMRRAAVSVPSNIAEGKGHRSDREFERFLLHARGSLLELETQIILSGDLGFGRKEDLSDLVERTEAVARSLNALINSFHRVTSTEIADAQRDWPAARAND
jgi:four helix bundle protein